MSRSDISADLADGSGRPGAPKAPSVFRSYPQLVDFVAGTCGGCAGVIIGHPLDTIKVRLQTGWMDKQLQQNPKISSVMGSKSTKNISASERRQFQPISPARTLSDSPKRAMLVLQTASAGSGARAPPSYSILAVATSMTKEEGIKSLYKGMLSPLIGVAVVNAFLFGVYGWCVDVLVDSGIGSRRPPNPSTARISSSPTYNDTSLSQSPPAAGPLTPLPTYLQVFLAGSFSGGVNAGVTVPMELIKCRLQANSSSDLSKGPGWPAPREAPPRRLDTTTGIVSDILRRSGVRGLYRGGFATILRDAPGYGAYFVAYDMLLDVLSGKWRGWLGNGSSSLEDVQSEETPTWQIVLAGGFAGVVGWATTYPMDVVKTRIQSGLLPDGSASESRNGVMSVIRTIYQREGLRAFFAGLSPTLVRAVPVNAATFYGVFWCKRMLES
ncbi:mitochondrial carrier [Gonapodya prolifera JEL478]|uniref:Mitochondrial carrier n=1 Tax=Gonapodya prolifera (strain JEL478) TaxID=1344416 RepID=A0A139AL81_GONPJ|nr:mitochondrial carrier [Gonapodya prolifera JEL478]|eukprot:KXS17500.1 mitochondrial carrier [Gonapodya prolifera JEL478]